MQDFGDDDDDDDGSGGNPGAEDNEINGPQCGTVSGSKIVGGGEENIRNQPFNVWIESESDIISTL